jgi:succinate dehydrogenase flavin-adding protein (antitoxin of CptAB toxin-antitoxin module)
MLFMVIERFRNRDAEAVYRRFREQGRMLPAGLKYIESWTEATLDRCFQLMECEDPRLFQQWVSRWEDLVEFEIIPVISSTEAANSTAQTLYS